MADRRKTKAADPGPTPAADQPPADEVTAPAEPLNRAARRAQSKGKQPPSKAKAPHHGRQNVAQPRNWATRRSG